MSTYATANGTVHRAEESKTGNGDAPRMLCGRVLFVGSAMLLKGGEDDDFGWATYPCKACAKRAETGATISAHTARTRRLHASLADPQNH